MQRVNVGSAGVDIRPSPKMDVFVILFHAGGRQCSNGVQPVLPKAVSSTQYITVDVTINTTVHCGI